MNRPRDRKVRYAVVGLGNIAQVAVLPAFAHASENSTLVALVSSDDQKRRQLSERYEVKITGSYAELDAILTSGAVDAIYIATPNTAHLGALQSAARAGVHVLCEKPLAATAADARRMIETAAAARIKLMTAYRLHFEQANLRAIERLRRGELGNPRFIHSTLSQQVREGDIRTRADLGGGALFDLGIYCINAARYLFRAEPIAVTALQVRGSDPRFAETDETTCATLLFPDHRVAQFTASQGAAEVSEFRVVGSRGDLRLEGAFGYDGESRELLTISGRVNETKTPRHDQFAPELLHFSRCILEDREPEPSGEEGLADIQIMEAIVRSAAEGRRIELFPIERTQRSSRDLEMCIPAVPDVETVNAPSPSR